MYGERNTIPEEEKYIHPGRRGVRLLVLYYLIDKMG